MVNFHYICKKFLFILFNFIISKFNRIFQPIYKNNYLKIINNLKKNKIEIIYIIGKKGQNVLNSTLSKKCFIQEKVGNIIYYSAQRVLCLSNSCTTLACVVF